MKKKKSLLGARCVCKGYLRKVNDGAYIEKIESDEAVDHQEHYILHSRELDLIAMKKDTSTPFDEEIPFSDEIEFVFGGPEYNSKFVPNYDERESSCCGEHELLKTYYDRKRLNFTGIIVGTEKVVAKGWLVVDTVNPYYSPEYCIIKKEPEEVIDCYIVYYAENRKRYVPFEDLTIETRGE